MPDYTDFSWVGELPAAITVTDADGIIREMNQRSVATFAPDGGSALIGKDVLECHPGESRLKTAQLYQTQKPNHYTIRKDGQRKMIHQLPWYQNGKFAGVVEISIPVPDELPHFERA